MIGKTNALTLSGGTTDTSGLRLKYLVFTSDAEWIEEDGGKITAGQVITLKSGSNVATAGSGTADYVPALTFDGWSSPLPISNNTITVPSDIEDNIVVGAMYHTTDGNTYYVDKSGVISTSSPSNIYKVVRVYLSNSVTSIANDYQGYYRLKTITIPNSVTSLGYSFNYCSYLGKIVIPSSVTSLESDFNGCYSIDTIVIPYGITTIADYTFNACSNLVSVRLPESVTTVGTGIFMSCSTLKVIKIPSHLTTISSSMFNSCSMLQNVIIPSEITGLVSFSFSTCQCLTDITVPSSVTKIDNYVFNSCRALESVTLLATTPPTLGGTSAFNTSYQKHIYVPAESVDAYKAATNWSTFADIIEAIPNS